MLDNGLEEIYNKFGGKLVGSMEMKIHVCQTLSKMPPKVINFIAKNCWFMGSMDDAWGYTFKGNDLVGQYLIFVSDDLLKQNADQIHHSIAHEIGHVLLSHRNSVNVIQTKAEIHKQEIEADRFANGFKF